MLEITREVGLDQRDPSVIPKVSSELEDLVGAYSTVRRRALPRRCSEGCSIRSSSCTTIPTGLALALALAHFTFNALVFV